MDPTRPTDLPLHLRIEAERIRRKKAARRELAHRFDYYGDECGCVCADGQCGRGIFEGRPCAGCGTPLGLGQCKEHLRARPEQRPPGSYRSASDQDHWANWLIRAGRGFGKTWTGAVATTWAVGQGLATRIALVNNTIRDVRSVQIEALYQVAPPWCKPLYEPSKATVTWRDEDGDELAVAGLYSAETPELLRGPQFDWAWADELAKWEHRQQETWDQLQFGLRMGRRPRVIITTTPRPTPTYLAVRRSHRTVVTMGSTKDNASQLAQTFIESIYDKYQNTRLGQQELEAAELLDAPGALWKTELIDATRKTDLVTAPGYPKPIPLGVEPQWVGVGVDPSAGALDPDTAAECGIVVVGRDINGHGYVLDDRSIKGTPGQWAEAVLRAYVDWHANVIVAERNNGGAMVEHTIRNARLDGMPVGETAPVVTVWASTGKRTRAEPVAMLTEQHRFHVCGNMPQLESQMTSWEPDSGDPSPDRLDAMVWAAQQGVVEFFNRGRAVARGRPVEVGLPM